MDKVWDTIFVAMGLIIFCSLVIVCSGLVWDINPMIIYSGAYAGCIVSLTALIMASIFRQRAADFSKQFQKEQKQNKLYIDMLVEENYKCYEKIDEMMKENEFLVSVLQNGSIKGIN
jgi:ATP-dependent protease ClpP protease subunit